jgi:hypothetical protein
MTIILSSSHHLADLIDPTDIPLLVLVVQLLNALQLVELQEQQQQVVLLVSCWR